MFREYPINETYPRCYGRVCDNPQRQTVTVAWIPLNLLLSLCFVIYWTAKRGFYMTEEVDEFHRGYLYGYKDAETWYRKNSRPLKKWNQYECRKS